MYGAWCLRIIDELVVTPGVTIPGVEGVIAEIAIRTDPIVPMPNALSGFYLPSLFAVRSFLRLIAV